MMTVPIRIANRAWAEQILLMLPPRERKRFNVIRDKLHITNHTLSSTLDSLEADGLIARIPSGNMRVEYELTSKGAALVEAIRPLHEWRKRWG